MKLSMRWRHSNIPVIDTHVHINRFDLMKPAAFELISKNETFPLVDQFVHSPRAFLDHMDRQGVWQSWLINYCAPQVMGYGAEVNAWAAKYASVDPGRLVAIGGYEPRTDGDGVAAVRGLRQINIRGLKIHTVHQHLSPDDARLKPALATCESLRMPVIFHTGTSRFPGSDNKFADPTPVATVAERHPDLQIIMAHGGRPDQTQSALAVLRQHKNTWIDVSSCPPHRIKDYFGDLEPLAGRVLWGSDWPGPGVPHVGENVQAFLELGFTRNTYQRILHDNAETLIEAER